MNIFVKRYYTCKSIKKKNLSSKSFLSEERVKNIAFENQEIIPGELSEYHLPLIIVHYWCYSRLAVLKASNTLPTVAFTSAQHDFMAQLEHR